VSNNLQCIFCVSETFLDRDFDDANLSSLANSHNVIRVDDAVRAGYGGGVMLLIPKFLNFSVNSEIANDFFELVSVCLFSGSAKFAQICLVYRSPSPNRTHSVQALNAALSNLFSRITLPTFVVGDFNFPDISWPTPPKNSLDLSFFITMLEIGFHQVVEEPTHKAGNILDLVFVSDLNFLSNIKVCSPISENADHYAINATIGPFNVGKVGHLSQFYNYKKANFEAMRLYLSQFDWHQCLSVNDSVEQMWSVFKNILLSCIAQFVPLCSYKPRKYVWSQSTVRLHKRQYRLHRKWKKSPSEENRQKWLESAKCARKAKRSDVYLTEKNSR
jgi:hypothetical protein